MLIHALIQYQENNIKSMDQKLMKQKEVIGFLAQQKNQMCIQMEMGTAYLISFLY